jgi:hypothetical protein
MSSMPGVLLPYLCERPKREKRAKDDKNLGHDRNSKVLPCTYESPNLPIMCLDFYMSLDRVQDVLARYDDRLINATVAAGHSMLRRASLEINILYALHYTYSLRFLQNNLACS